MGKSQKTAFSRARNSLSIFGCDFNFLSPSLILDFNRKLLFFASYIVLSDIMINVLYQNPKKKTRTQFPQLKYCGRLKKLRRARCQLSAKIFPQTPTILMNREECFIRITLRVYYKYYNVHKHTSVSFSAVINYATFISAKRQLLILYERYTCIKSTMYNSLHSSASYKRARAYLQF